MSRRLRPKRPAIGNPSRPPWRPDSNQTATEKTGAVHQDGIYERPDSPYYWATYVNAGGRRVRRSTGIRTSAEGRREAEALLAKWKLETHKVRQWDEPPQRRFVELMLGYLQATGDRKRRSETDRFRARALRRHFAGKQINTLSRVDVSRYRIARREEGVTDSTINRDLALLSSAINFANREWDWRLPNPVAGRQLSEPEGRVRWIAEDEAARLIVSADAGSGGLHPRGDQHWLPKRGTALAGVDARRPGAGASASASAAHQGREEARDSVEPGSPQLDSATGRVPEEALSGLPLGVCAQGRFPGKGSSGCLPGREDRGLVHPGPSPHLGGLVVFVRGCRSQRAGTCSATARSG